jgi:uncharacterized protein (DUF2062 family)
MLLRSSLYQLYVRSEPNMSNIVPPPYTEHRGEISADATSNEFRIVGGPKLYKKEIVGVAVGTVVGIVLFGGAVAWGLRVWRRRRFVRVAF